MAEPESPLRILFLGPDGVAHVTRWVRFLRGAGHEVTLASAHLIDHDEPCGSTPLVAKPGTSRMSGVAALRAAHIARRLARKIRPDLIVSYNLTSYGLIAALAGLHPHVCATAGGDVLEDPFDTWGRRILNRVALAIVRRRADRLLAWAPHVQATLVARGVPPQSVFVQPRGVLLDKFAFRPPRESARGEPLRILSNRMFKPLYGIDVLLRALLSLRERGRPFEARLCGDGPIRPDLERLARELGLGAETVFVGTVPADRMPEELAWSDVYVSTSYTDGASSSLFEAMAVGRFSVVTDLPANRPFVEEGRSGMLFPPGDAAALSRMLDQVASNRSLCRSGGLRAREIAVERLDYRENMRRIENILREAVRKRRGTPSFSGT